MGMPKSTITEQVAAHLREQIRRGRWKTSMPGKDRLARELEVSPRTVQRALKVLEGEGTLEAQGGGRRRKVVAVEGEVETRPLLVRILTYERSDEGLVHHVHLQGELQKAGHTAHFTSKSLQDLGMDAKRVARFVEQTAADAWVVCSGARPVLEWFAAQPVPAFALFGSSSGVRIAGMVPRKNPALAVAVRRLVDLGHRRIVMLVREERLKPYPATFEQTFLNELTASGIAVGSYNLPLWEDNRSGFHRCLESLLEHTPPTALIVSEPMLFHAAKDHLARRGLLAPEHVSLICDDPDLTFGWCEPSIAHIAWDHRPIVRRVLHWATNVARGRTDHRQSFTLARFVEGGTVGPVLKGR
jgi:DNA-binding LacI/PurR family transcriptional regulator